MFSPKVYDLRSLYPKKNVSIPKLPAHYPDNERYSPAFPSSLHSAYAFDVQTRHSRGRDLGLKLISLDQGWYGQFMHLTYLVTRMVGRKLTLYPSLFRGRVQSAKSKG